MKAIIGIIGLILILTTKTKCQEIGDTVEVYERIGVIEDVEKNEYGDSLKELKMIIRIVDDSSYIFINKSCKSKPKNNEKGNRKFKFIMVGVLPKRD